MALFTAHCPCGRSYQTFVRPARINPDGSFSRRRGWDETFELAWCGDEGCTERKLWHNPEFGVPRREGDWWQMRET